MRKLFLTAVGFCLLLALILTGCDCSCSNTPALDFTNAFNNSQKPALDYVETLTYDVFYNGDGKDYGSLKKSSATDAYILKENITYSGTLTTTFEVGDINRVPKGVSDIVGDENANKEKITEVYIFTTSLKLNAKYKFVGEEQERQVNDTIDTTVYFLPETMSFAPVYSTYKADMHLVQASSTEKLFRYTYDYKTAYNLNKVTVTSTLSSFDSDGNETKVPAQTKSNEYDYKRVIDNNQLLFALRNFETNEEQATLLPVLTPSYGKTKDLLISAHTTENINMDFDEEAIPVKKFSLKVNDQYTSGNSHYFSIQTGKTNSTESKALLISFAQPLIDYGTTSCLGALEFKLKSIA